ncbi:MAG: hypothetical protein HYX69_10810 [Planctomycetia bacterium]|nr:hypothetical protein [Planctomycetia bacterium]
MRRALGLMPLVVLAAIGCQSPPAATDPFLRARVPPPSTGQIGAPPATTYATVGAPGATAAPAGQYVPPGGTFSYGGGMSTPGAVGAPPSAAPNYAGSAAPGYAAPNAIPSYPPAATTAPPGAMTPYQPPATLPAATPSATPPRYAPPGRGWGPSSSTGTGAAAGQSASNGSAIRLRPLSQTIDERRLASAAGTRPADADQLPTEQSLGVPDRLAEAPMASPLKGRRASRDSDIEPASYKASQDDVERVKRSVYTRQRDADADDEEGSAAGRSASAARAAPKAAAADQGATYGYGGNYAWLEGRLEYATATRRWKLRYIPIDGPTDRFGGSVVLAETPALAGYRSGDFVSIKGQLDGRAIPQGTYAPLYQVSEVHRLTD